MLNKMLNKSILKYELYTIISEKYVKKQMCIRDSTYTAQDYMLYLIRSKGTYKFKKKKPEQITKLICKDLKIKTKSIAKTNMKIKKLLFQDKEYYNMILAAYSKAYKKTGTSYQLIMDGDKLSVIKKGSMLNVRLDQKERCV